MMQCSGQPPISASLRKKKCPLPGQTAQKDENERPLLDWRSKHSGEELGATRQFQGGIKGVLERPLEKEDASRAVS